MIRGGGNNTPCVHHCVPGPPLPLNHSWRPPSPPLQGVSRGGHKQQHGARLEQWYSTINFQLTKGFKIDLPVAPLPPHPI